MRRSASGATRTQTVVRVLALAGIVCIVGGTAAALESWAYPAARFGLGSRPARTVVLYVDAARMRSRRDAGAAFPTGSSLHLEFDATQLARYRMDASPVDASFAVLARPVRGDCCAEPSRITWHEEADPGGVALPIRIVGAGTAAEAVSFGALADDEISDDEAAALRPAILSRQPLLATIDLADPAAPRVYDLRSATDAEITAHERLRPPAHR